MDQDCAEFDLTAVGPYFSCVITFPLTLNDSSDCMLLYDNRHKRKIKANVSMHGKAQFGSSGLSHILVFFFLVFPQKIEDKDAHVPPKQHESKLCFRKKERTRQQANKTKA